MDIVRVEVVGPDNLKFSSKPLATTIIGRIKGMVITLICIPFFVPSVLVSITEYLRATEESNQGYYQELVCQRLEPQLVNCKLELTDVYNQKHIAFSRPIKGAVQVVAGETEDGYICGVELIAKDGQRITNISLLQSEETSKDCKKAKATILEESSKHTSHLAS